MRKLVLLTVIFAVFLGSASAQDTLPRPKKPGVTLVWADGGCIRISWNIVENAATYQVRVTKYGSGKLEYRANSLYAQLWGWQDWQNDGVRSTMGYGKKRFANWCGLAPNQMIRARVRAVDAQGNPGANSKPRKIFIPG